MSEEIKKEIVVNKFEEAANIDVSKLMKKKGQAEYIPWASAWSVFKKVNAKGNFQFLKNDNFGHVFEERLPSAIGKDGKVVEGILLGYLVKVVVTNGELGDDEITHELPLPLMDFKMKANMNFTVMEVNKALFRCLTKVVTMFGAGISAYAGDEYYQFEIGSEFNAVKEQILELAKEMAGVDDKQRAIAIGIIGHKGRTADIKDLEEANDTFVKLKEALEKAKVDVAKKIKATTKTTTKTEPKG